MRDYIPDLTERFPEGFGGVDMTDRYCNDLDDLRQLYKAKREESMLEEERNNEDF